MILVIVGPRDRDRAADEVKLREVIDGKLAEDSRLIVASAGCERGVGLEVKKLCLSRKRPVRFLEVGIKVWGQMTRSETAQIWLVRNAALVELGDEFLVFQTTDGRKALVNDLIARVREVKKPLTVVE